MLTVIEIQDALNEVNKEIVEAIRLNKYSRLLELQTAKIMLLQTLIETMQTAKKAA